jgi:hypothetical protein
MSEAPPSLLSAWRKYPQGPTTAKILYLFLHGSIILPFSKPGHNKRSQPDAGNVNRQRLMPTQSARTARPVRRIAA